jgi:hypothetical protein
MSKPKRSDKILGQPPANVDEEQRRNLEESLKETRTICLSLCGFAGIEVIGVILADPLKNYKAILLPLVILQVLLGLIGAIPRKLESRDREIELQLMARRLQIRRGLMISAAICLAVSLLFSVCVGLLI